MVSQKRGAFRVHLNLQLKAAAVSPQSFSLTLEFSLLSFLERGKENKMLKDKFNFIKNKFNFVVVTIKYYSIFLGINLKIQTFNYKLKIVFIN